MIDAFGRLAEPISRGIRKSPRVVAVRAAQELRLRAMHRLKRWPSLETRIRRWWSDARIRDYISARHSHLCLIAKDAPEALRRAAAAGDVDGEALLSSARSIRERQFGLLGAEMPREGAWPWNTERSI